MSTRAGLEMRNAPDGIDETPEATWNLCYLVCVTDAAIGYCGAILLTDCRARPLYFAFVQPVKPTKLQRILYGSTLDEHIKVDVIAHKLWQGLPKPPDVLFVDSPELVAARRITHVPTACISKPSDSASSSVVRYDVGPHMRDESTVAQIVVSLEGNCNLHEPFSRIREALKETQKMGA